MSTISKVLHLEVDHQASVFPSSSTFTCSIHLICTQELNFIKAMFQNISNNYTTLVDLAEVLQFEELFAVHFLQLPVASESFEAVVQTVEAIYK